jgi:CheY-like chemotaxis protein
MTTKPRVLCVDDDPAVLDGMSLHLRRHYEVKTTSSPKAALEILAQQGPFQAVLSDMRMPGCDGAQFLTQVRETWPYVTRMLLTGQADVESAIHAVNGGQIFRFLTKPCPPQHLKASFDAAIEQNRLVLAEKELIGKTLRGSLQALMDVLAISHPEAFGRAGRVKRRVAAMVTSLNWAQAWELDMASLLCHIGYISLPPETARKTLEGKALTPSEASLVAAIPRTAAKILGHIPRLDPVLALLEEVARLRLKESAPLPEKQAALLLHLVLESDDLQSRGIEIQDLAAALQAPPNRFDPKWVMKLIELLLAEAKSILIDVDLRGLELGMVIAEDIKSTQGTLLVARGFEVTEGLLERLRNLPKSMVQEPLRVRPAVQTTELSA